MHREFMIEAEKLIKELVEDDNTHSHGARLLEIFRPIFENEKRKMEKEKYKLSLSYMGNDPQAMIARVIDGLCNITSLYEQAEADIHKTERITQDILHAMELTDPDEQEMMRLATELQKVRQHRRESKNFIEQTLPFYNCSKSCADIVSKLRKAQGEMNNIRMSISERRYYPRELNSMESAFVKATSRAN